MTTTINGRTPEEIKKGLENGKSNREYVECCETDCPYESNCKPGSNQMVEVPFALVRDALECIQQLERERDAAVEAQPEWISVEERLPGDPLDGVGDVVELLIDKGDVKEVLPGYYDHDEEDWVIYFGDILGDYRRNVFSWWRVIKWRPFPEPPKEA